MSTQTSRRTTGRTFTYQTSVPATVSIDVAGNVTVVAHCEDVAGDLVAGSSLATAVNRHTLVMPDVSDRPLAAWAVNYLTRLIDVDAGENRPQGIDDPDLDALARLLCRMTNPRGTGYPRAGDTLPDTGGDVCGG